LVDDGMCSKPATADKEDDLTYDLGNLYAFDVHPFKVGDER
jgi:hypothetical protein